MKGRWDMPSERVLAVKGFLENSSYDEIVEVIKIASDLLAASIENLAHDISAITDEDEDDN